MADTPTKTLPATTSEPRPRTDGMKVRLSTLWVFAAVNYIYCDVLGIMDPENFHDLAKGQIAGVDVTQSFLLGSAILLEIPFAMIFLSRLLEYRVNRWANVAAGAIMTVVQFGSVFVGGGSPAYYIFFSAIEIAATLAIVWFALHWRALDAAAVAAARSRPRMLGR